ncbi:M23 family metallopeptidase [Paracrocinitomix mangrovi]|uniref:M23 family metallopeptidase n=1 Tax=Paracrocinitomix mangrovi TaxID=2862509 RepID=UPI001C8E0469|nr:M23 family metallopeptidase [Paracrocinitomix mangrovi]UKN03315.1 M23 family metallopeptidase [Paracrocinitomix mangrovi]
MKFILSLLFFSAFIGYAQPYAEKQIDFENIDLLPPMKIPLILAGNFGEMRSNHFHTGLDIKTQGVEGQKLYSIDEGTVSRVRVSPWGYGLAVYIDHPNGLTSVYAHMQSFSKQIDSLVFALQESNETYILDEAVLDKGIKVNRGQLIGLSGNSGSSSAPHLHFEVRETKTEHALNPLLFSCYQKRIHDKTKPTLKGLKVYAVTEKGYMIPGKSKYFYVKFINGNHLVNDGAPIDVSEFITENSFMAFAFHVTDRLDGAGNVCGVHNTFLSKGEDVLHEQKTDYINFDHNRFLNSHQDYYEFDQNRRNIHKNFKTVVNPLPIYPKAGGLVKWKDCKGKYSFKAIDVHGNWIRLNFEITISDNATKANNPFDTPNNYYFPDSVNTLLQDDFQVLMEPGTFYEPLQKIFKVNEESQYMSNEFQFSESEIPVQKRFDVRIKTPQLRSDFPVSKLGIGVISDKGWMSFLGGDYINGWVESSSRSFGTFVLTVDSVAPVITPLDFNEGKIVSRYSNVQLTIEDNLSGVSKYKAYFNDHWVLMEYNRRKKRYVINFDERTKKHMLKGDNKLRIWASDSKGNEIEKTWTIQY